MPQSSILAPGITLATSTDIVIAQGAVVTIGLYTDSSSSGSRTSVFTILQDTPGLDRAIGVLSSGTLSQAEGSLQIVGPGTFRVQRSASDGRPFGVFIET